jgi:putative endonuclease
MRQHIRTGKIGEQLAVQWLVKNGYMILHRNWRCGRYEIDIIAKCGNNYHCIEVKTRKGKKYGYPEEGVTKKKMYNLMQAAHLFEAGKEDISEVQVDILAVSLEKNSASFFLIENAGLGYQL